MSSTPPARTLWVDIAKGIGIILVVVGHTLRGLDKTPVIVPGWQYVDAWIYAFHMPVFFFVAGLFLERSCRHPLGTFITEKAGRILWPYFLWTVFQEGFRHLGSRSPLRLDDLWTIVYRPVMQFWFLYVLFLLLVLYAVWRKSGFPWQAFVAAALALNLSMAFGLSYGPWGVVYQIGINAPYLAAGVLVAGTGIFPKIEKQAGPLLIAVAAAGYGAIALAAGFLATGIPAFVLPLALVGIASTTCLSVLLGRLPVSTWLALLGNLSLEIFVAHTIFSSGLRQGLLSAGIHNPAIHVAGGVVIGISGPLVLYAVCRRLNLLFLFSLPPSSHVPLR